MSLTLPEVERIAQLAKIRITPDEAKVAQSQLNDIFRLIETMQAVDTSGIAPMAHAQDVSQRLRADAVSFSDPDGVARDRFLQNAPEAAQGLYLVPKVIE